MGKCFCFILDNFSKWKSRKVFLLSKEFNIFGILIVLIGSFNNQTRTIFDVCDLFILKKKLSLRERLNKYFVELILIKVDLVIASSIELKKTIQNFYGRNKVIIIEDELEFEFLPSSCSIKKQDYLCIGWFGNSGYLSHKKVKPFSQRELRINSSLNLISKIIKKNIDLKTKTKFILLTNHLKSKYLSRYLGDNYIEYVCIEKYNIFNIEKFFSSIDKLLITYGDDSFSRTKSTNRVDTGLWLVKEVHVLNNPYNWNNSKIDTTNFVVESQELNECFSKISNNNYVF